MTIPHGAATDTGDGASPAGALPGQVASLLDVSYAITGATDLNALVRALSEVVASYGVDTYNLTRYHKGPSAYVEIVASWDKRGGSTFPAGMRFPDEAFTTLRLVSAGRPVIIQDCANDPKLDESSKRVCAEAGTISLSLIPMSQGSEVLGLLSLTYGSIHETTPEELTIFGVLAQLTMVALQNIEGRALLAKKVAKCDALYRIGEVIAESAEEDGLFQKAADLLVAETGYVSAWIGTVDEEARVLRERALAGIGAYPGRELWSVSLDNHGATAIAVLDSGQLRASEDAQEKADAEGWGSVAREAGLRSVGHAPLRAGGKVLGVVALGSTEERIAEDELSLIGAFSSQLASTVLRAQLGRERAKQVAALEDAYASQAALLETVRELSTPVIPVHDGVLVLPLVGMIDSARSAQVTEALLNAIQREKASVVIIDITGVPTVDTGVANHLLRSARAARLLGAACVLVGVGPAVAQTLVALGVDFSDLVTRGNLQAGIAYALARLDGAPGRGGLR